MVREIHLEGAKRISEGEIKGKILTTEPAWPWEVEIFDPNAWQADLRRIERYYEAQGYYQAQVVEDEVVPRQPGWFRQWWARGTRWAAPGVDLRVTVSEGAPTRVGEVRIEGLGALTEAQRASLLEDFPLEKGRIFREADWTEIKPLMRSRLREMGYAEAAVEGNVEVDVESHLARVVIEAIPGERYKFGDIFVATGANPKVPHRWVIDEAAQAIEKGDWYSETALDEAQARVFKMGVFGGVKVARGTPDAQSGIVPVVVDVREAPFRTLRAGGGLGVDQTRDEVRLLLEYTNRNFFGGLRSLTTQTRVGWALLPAIEVPSGIRRSEPVANVTAEFTQPRVLNPSVRYFLTLQGEYRPELAYALAGGQFKTGLAWSPHPAVTTQLTYNFQAFHFFRAEVLLGGRSTELAFGCGKTCLLSFAEAQVEWDRRMRQYPSGLRPDLVDPTTGYFLGFSVQYGGGPLRGDYTYVRVLPEARLYRSPPGERVTFALRARAGTLISAAESRRDSPIVSRFFAGGANSMRGYNNRRLSPLQLIPPDPARPPQDALVISQKLGRQEGEVVPIGGERLFEASAEARYRLNSDFQFAVFVDAGFNNLADRLGNDITVQNAPEYLRTYMQYAVGAGLRYMTLVGPIRLDLAYRLPWGTPPRVYQTPNTYLLPPPGGGCFGFGNYQGDSTTNPEGRCTLNISIGEAF